MIQSYAEIVERWSTYLDKLSDFVAEGYSSTSIEGARIAFTLTMEKLNILVDLLESLRDKEIDPNDGGEEVYIDQILTLLMSTCPYCKLARNYCSDCVFHKCDKYTPPNYHHCFEVCYGALDEYATARDTDYDRKIEYLEAFLDWLEEMEGGR